MTDRRQEMVRSERRRDVTGGENDIPTGVAAHDARQHFLVAFIHAVPHPSAVLCFEFRHSSWVYIGRPIEDIQAGPPVSRAASQSRRGHQEMAAVHADLN